jgi:hypothetical protein
MSRKQSTLITAIECHLVAAHAARDFACDTNNADEFNAACERIRRLEDDLADAYRGKRPAVDAVTAELVANNCD